MPAPVLSDARPAQLILAGQCPTLLAFARHVDPELCYIVPLSPPYLPVSSSSQQQIIENRALDDFRVVRAVRAVRIFRRIRPLGRFLHDNGRDA
jgi:hypothetical protein